MKTQRDIQERVVGYLLTCRDNELKDLSIYELTKEIGARPGEIARMFRKNLNTNFKTYKNREIAARILMLLRKQPYIWMKTVAKRFAFQDVSELEKVFEDYFTVSASSYRAYIKQMQRRTLASIQIIPGIPAGEFEMVSN
jgi:transcriptional regulator GlxA family with amidase domain